MSEEWWWVQVTDEDIRLAREAWQTARDSGAPAERVEMLCMDLERLWTAQARQNAADFRRARSA